MTILPCIKPIRYPKKHPVALLQLIRVGGLLKVPGVLCLGRRIELHPWLQFQHHLRDVRAGEGKQRGRHGSLHRIRDPNEASVVAGDGSFHEEQVSEGINLVYDNKMKAK